VLEYLCVMRYVSGQILELFFFWNEDLYTLMRRILGVVLETPLQIDASTFFPSASQTNHISISWYPPSFHRSDDTPCDYHLGYCMTREFLSTLVRLTATPVVTLCKHFFTLSSLFLPVSSPRSVPELFNDTSPASTLAILR